MSVSAAESGEASGAPTATAKPVGTFIKSFAMVAMESQDDINAREWRSPINWSSGFYSSKIDSRLWVPKRGLSGSGFALNLGHRGARTVIATFCVVPASVVLLLVLLHYAR